MLRCFWTTIRLATSAANCRKRSTLKSGCNEFSFNPVPVSHWVVKCCEDVVVPGDQRYTLDSTPPHSLQEDVRPGYVAEVVLQVSVASQLALSNARLIQTPPMRVHTGADEMVSSAQPEATRRRPVGQVAVPHDDTDAGSTHTAVTPVRALVCSASEHEPAVQQAEVEGDATDGEHLSMENTSRNRSPAHWIGSCEHAEHVAPSNDPHENHVHCAVPLLSGMACLQYHTTQP